MGGFNTGSGVTISGQKIIDLCTNLLIPVHEWFDIECIPVFGTTGGNRPVRPSLWLMPIRSEAKRLPPLVQSKARTLLSTGDAWLPSLRLLCRVQLLEKQEQEVTGRGRQQTLQVAQTVLCYVLVTSPAVSLKKLNRFLSTIKKKLYMMNLCYTWSSSTKHAGSSSVE